MDTESESDSEVGRKRSLSAPQGTFLEESKGDEEFGEGQQQQESVEFTPDVSDSIPRRNRNNEARRFQDVADSKLGTSVNMKPRRRLVQGSDESASETADDNLQVPITNLSPEMEKKSAKKDRQKALAELANKRKSNETAETRDVHEKSALMSKRRRTSRFEQDITPKESKTALMVREMTKLVANATLSKDTTYTRRRCKDQLSVIFGSDIVQSHEEFLRREFDAIAKYCMHADEESLKEIKQRKDIRAVQSKASKPNPKSHSKSKDHRKSKDSRLSKEEIMMRRKQYLTYHLEKIIAKASIDQDPTLTKRTCRERLAMSVSFDDNDLEHINSEIIRISVLCKELTIQDVQEMANKPEILDVDVHDQATNMEDFGDGSESNLGSESESDSDYEANESKRKRPHSKGILSGMVVAPCGKELLQNKVAIDKLRDLIVANGGKLQSCVTRKVNYVVISNSGFLKNNDSRVASARKHGAKLVKESFFEECVRQQTIVSIVDHIAVHADSRRKQTEKVDFEEEVPEHVEDTKRDSSDLSDRDGPVVKNSKRVTVRRSKEDSEWLKEVRARFSYVKDARTRIFDPRDPVVPESSFLSHKGMVYNAFLTLTDFDENEDGQTKFFAIKLVEAGGLMKGEKWHVITQWGKVGTTKPGCEVTDFDDLNEAINIFKQRFLEKTRNTWESSAFGFRTVSGKYTMEEFSDEDHDFDSLSFIINDSSVLENSVQILLKKIFSLEAANEFLCVVGIDLEKLNFKNMKRNVVREAFGELQSIQRLIQREQSKLSEKDFQKVRLHSERFGLLLQFEKSEKPDYLVDSVQSVKENTKIVEELNAISVVRCAWKGCLHSSQKRIDELYSVLRSHINPISEFNDQFQFVSKVLAVSSNGFEPLRMQGFFSVQKAGEFGRFAAFEGLERMMLWRAVRKCELVSTLVQGVNRPSQEAPSVAYPLGKGLYFYDCASEAVAAAGLTREAPAEYLILCEVALGSTFELMRPSRMLRAPHGFHSVHAKGRISFAKEDKVQFLDEQGLSVVAGIQDQAHGNRESVFQYNQYVVYDVAQV